MILRIPEHRDLFAHKGQMDSGARKNLSCVHEWTGTVGTVLDNEGEMLWEEGLRN